MFFRYNSKTGNDFMRKILFLSLLVAATSFVHIGASKAQDIAPQPCDTKYWEQMHSRAWLEAEREIMQNQNLIFKPDSVLEYVCFDQFVSLAAWPGGDIFVHTDYFGKKIIERGAAGSMEKGLESVVSGTLDAYKSNAKFTHTFLGGRAEHMDIADKNSDFKPATTNQSYTCKTMANIWKAAKCANFVDNSAFQDTDGFYPFDELKAHNGGKDVGGYADSIKETRKFPSDMSCGNGASQGVTTWKEQLRKATLEEELYKFKAPLSQTFKDVGNRIEPGNCSAAFAVKTGVKVIINGEESHDDGVCTNPGCSYTKGGGCSSGGA